MEMPDLQPPLNGTPNTPPHPDTPIERYGPLARLLIASVGVDKTILASQCRPQDASIIKMQGALLYGSVAYSGLVMVLMGQKLFSPENFNPVLALASLGPVALLGTVDAYVFYYGSWFEQGVKLLTEWGGLPGSKDANHHYVANALKYGIRTALSVPFAALTGIFLSTAVYQNDIRHITHQRYLNDNQAGFTQATALVDEKAGHATQAVKVKEAEIVDLSNQVNALREKSIVGSNTIDSQSGQREIDNLLSQQASALDDVRKSEAVEALEMGGVPDRRTSGTPGNGPRHRAAVQEVANAKAHALQISDALTAARARLDALREKGVSSSEAARQRSERDLPAFEDKLRQANIDLATLKQQVDDIVQNRNETIRTLVETSPGYIANNNGVLAEISALNEIRSEDSTIWWTVFFFELASVALELAAVCSKLLVQVPTDYARIVARDHILHSVKIVDEMITEFNRNPNIGTPRMWVTPANDNEPGSGPIMAVEPSGDFEPPEPPKRGRGRPRKNTLN